jgi:hypothetical protein
MDVMAAEEIAAVAKISRTQPLVEEALVEVIGHDQQKLDLTKSWKVTYFILAKECLQICYAILK